MKKAMVMASVASMLDQFNRDNIRILMEMGYDVTVACNFDNGNSASKERIEVFKQDMENAGVRMLQLPVPRKVSGLGGFLRAISKMRKDVEKNQYELVHCQAPFSGVVARMACRNARKRGTKVIYYAHGFHFFKGASWKNWLIYYNVERFCAHYTDCIITLNQEDYQRAKKKLKAKRVEYVKGVGVNLERIRALKVDRKKKCEELDIPPDSRIVLSVGELSERKNTKVALQAFAKADIENSVMLICGIGDKMDELKGWVSGYGLIDRVRFLGYRTDIDEICQIADVFVFPSKQEGLPVALMQAMAGGTPVLCSDIRGNHDLIKNGVGGYLYSPNDIGSYVSGLKCILSEPMLAEKMGKANLETIKEYDLQHVNEWMRAMYQRVVQGEMVNDR